MKFLTILIFIFSPFNLSAKSLEEKICGNEFTSATLLSDWKIDPLNYCDRGQCSNELKDRLYELKEQRIGGTYCAEAECTKESKKVRLRKCFYQTSSQLFHYKIERRENNSYQANTFNLPITQTDLCYEDCKKIKNAFLPFSFLDTRGLHRESCQKCFMNREEEVNVENDFFDYPEIGKKIYRGQKCFALCKDPDSEVVVNRTLSQECQKCVGLNGNPGDLFRFIKTKKGDCFEVENDQKIRMTLPPACVPEKTTFTFFQKDKKISFGTLFRGEIPSCYELDNQTGGRLYNRYTDQENCTDESKSNNQSRQISVDKNQLNGNSSRETKASTSTQK